MKAKTILNTEIVKIVQTDEGFHTYIKMQEGGWLEHATFPPELKGLVNALDLATNCAAGKFYPKRITTDALGIEVELKELDTF